MHFVARWVAAATLFSLSIATGSATAEQSLQALVDATAVGALSLSLQYRF